MPAAVAASSLPAAPMATRREHDTEFEFQDPGFSAFCHRLNQSVAHRHNDLELCINEHAGGVALFGGQKVTFIPDHLVVMWGSMPHKPLTLEPVSVAYGIRVPMHWVLRWRLPDTLTRRLLNFEVIVDCKRNSPCSDLALLKPLPPAVAESVEALVGCVAGAVLSLVWFGSDLHMVVPPIWKRGGSGLFAWSIAALLALVAAIASVTPPSCATQPIPPV